MIESIIDIIRELFKYVYIFRIGWVVTVLIGVVLLITGLIVGKNNKEGKMPWIVGGIGAVLAISSSVQLIFSIFW